MLSKAERNYHMRFTRANLVIVNRSELDPLVRNEDLGEAITNNKDHYADAQSHYIENYDIES